MWCAGFHCSGFSCLVLWALGLWASIVVAHGLWSKAQQLAQHLGLVAPWHVGFSGSDLNPCLLCGRWTLHHGAWRAQDKHYLAEST